MRERGPGSSGGGGVCGAVRGGVPQRALGEGAAGLSKAGAHLCIVSTHKDVSEIQGRSDKSGHCSTASRSIWARSRTITNSSN